MGEPKPLLRWGEATILHTIIQTLFRAGLGEPPAVVVGAHAAAVAREAERGGARCLPNERHSSGRFTSVQTAASWALEGRRATGGKSSLILWPVDCPGVGVETIRTLLALAPRFPDSNLVPAFRGRRGHPVLLCDSLLQAIVHAPPDSNLRDLLQGGSAARFVVAVDDPGILVNLNTRDDYESFLRQRPRESERTPGDD
jgi:CTP:molybdopterin cytidylyltransferase MocA